MLKRLRRSPHMSQILTTLPLSRVTGVRRRPTCIDAPRGPRGGATGERGGMNGGRRPVRTAQLCSMHTDAGQPPAAHLARSALLAVVAVHAGVQGGLVERLPPLARLLLCGVRMRGRRGGRAVQISKPAAATAICSAAAHAAPAGAACCQCYCSSSSAPEPPPTGDGRVLLVELLQLHLEVGGA